MPGIAFWAQSLQSYMAIYPHYSEPQYPPVSHTQNRRYGPFSTVQGAACPSGSSWQETQAYVPHQVCLPELLVRDTATGT